MGGVTTDLLPADAELARRAAGGDGAAFVRLYDHYCEYVFELSLAATGSADAAADATQTAFLRLLRRPPALGAPDTELPARLRALALADARPPMRIDATNGGEDACAGGVGWLRSETVAKAGAKFDEDWSVYLWTPEPAAGGERTPEANGARRRRRRLRLPRRALPSPAAAIVLLLLLLASAVGIALAADSADPTEPEPLQARQPKRAQSQADEAPPPLREKPKLLRNEALEPLLAP